MSCRSTIKLYWSGGGTGFVNFGDYLSKEIVEFLSCRFVEYASPSEADLCAIGSLLEKIHKHSWKRPFKFRINKIQIWGTGSMFNGPMNRLLFADVWAVRGPISRKLLNLRSDIQLGDPGLLCNMLIEGKRAIPEYRVGIVPHIVDANDPMVEILKQKIPNSTVLDLTNPDVRFVIQQISRCETIISSSLHGIIAADAFGISRARISFSDKIKGGDHKFNDHNYSVGLGKLLPITADAIDVHRLENIVQIPPQQKLRKLQETLIKSFHQIGF